MRKIICALTLILLLSACGEEKDERIAALEAENAALAAENDSLRTQIEKWDEISADDNPIDRFYETVDDDGSTAAMNTVANSKADDWEAEARHIAEELKEQLPLQEDRDLVDEYLLAAEQQIERMDVMAIYSISDVSIPHPERVNYSGTLRGVMWAGSRMRLWRDTFEQLRSISPTGWNYTYLFDADAARAKLDDLLS